MAHRNTRSQGNVPFSWEEKPGISKFSSPNCSSDMMMIIRNTDNNPSKISNYMMNMMISRPPPPPPPWSGHESSSSPSSRNFWIKGRRLWGGGGRRRDDPFVAAMKNCTKEIKQQSIDDSNGKVKKNVFSCKKSCDVEEGNLVKVSSFQLPPLPRERKKYYSNQFAL